MADYLTKLRRKPKHVRDNIAFGVAGGLTGVLALVWFLAGFSGGTAGTAPEISTKDNPKAFSTFLNQMKEQVATVRDAIPKKPATSTAAGADIPVEGAFDLSTSSDQRMLPKEASIMLVSASTTGATSTQGASTSVLY